MKTMTCRELGRTCGQAFHAETFDEIAKLSKAHAMTMFAAQDPAHLQAMQAMQERMKDPRALQAWFDERRRAFEALPDS